MFADQAVTLGLDFPVARDQFLLLTHGNRLDGMSQDAYADGLAGQIRVGPLGGLPGMSKLVRVSLLDPVPPGDHHRHRGRAPSGCRHPGGRVVTGRPLRGRGPMPVAAVGEGDPSGFSRIPIARCTGPGPQPRVPFEVPLVILSTSPWLAGN